MAPNARLFQAFLAALLLVGIPTRADLINEIRPNPPGTDPATQLLELLGPPGAAFSGWLLSIESDSGASPGTVDRAEPVAGTFDANGLLTAIIDDLENPSFTLALVRTFTGAIGSDIDTDNDGVADDLSTFGTLLDAIGVPDSVGDESTLYGAQLGGTDFAYIGGEPQLIFRDGTTLAWYAVDDTGAPTAGVFDLSGRPRPASAFDADPTGSTFGAVNPTTMPSAQAPVPPTLPLAAAGLLAVFAVGRKRRLSA
jgi:hypothetical protein